MQNKSVRILIFLCIVVIGCYATIAQVILVREFLNIFYGNELCLGIVFGAWFSGIAIGAFAGLKIERISRYAIIVFGISLLAMCIVLPVQIISIRCIRGILNVGVGEYISFLPLLFTSFGLILPFSFIIGFIFPFSSKVIQGATSDIASDIGSVFIIESIGSLIGGIVFSFFLVTRLHPFKVLILLNASLSFLLFFLFICFDDTENRKTKKVLKFISLAFTLSMIMVWFSPVPDKIETLSAKIRWKTLNPNIELVKSVDSKYQHIDIGRQSGQYSIYLNGQYAASFPNEYEYAQVAHLVMTQHPSPKHVLLLGCGLGGLISEMLLYPIETLDYVELDQKLLPAVEEHLSASDKRALSDRRITIFNQDGRYYIKNTSKKNYYDIVLISIPDPSTAFLNRFYTVDFFKEVQDVLKHDGVFATSVSSAVTYIGKEVGSYTGSLYCTLHNTFKNVLVTPGQTNYYFACNRDGIITLDIKTLTERYVSPQISSDYFTEYIFYTLLQPEQVQFIEAQLSKRKDLILNTDVKPVTYFLNLTLWTALTGSNMHELFLRLNKTGLKSFLIPIIAALIGRIIYIVIKRSKGADFYNTRHLRTNCLIVLATTGFTGIAIEILLMYAFQNIYGYIYEKMGIIVAIFMVGLALGGYIANSIIQKGGILCLKDKIPFCLSHRSSISNKESKILLYNSDTKWISFLMIIEGIIILYVLIIPFIVHVLSFYSVMAEVGLIILIGIAGILTGLEFPLVNKIFMRSCNNITISSGLTDSADHIGAFSGAILTGVIFLPLLGISGTCLILTVINVSSLILITFSALSLKKSN
jgi:spermidine synthase